jgi:coenzyme F420-reducing hydrogenase alpha subunit
MRDRENKSLPLAKLIVKGSVSATHRMAAAQVLEDYANQNISEELEAFGQFMYHAELLRNDHLDVYLIDLHMVDQPYRDMLVTIVGSFHSMES